MRHTTNTPNNRQGEDTFFANQLNTIFQYLQNHVATASMVAAATGIPQKNICRYKRDLELSGRLWEIEKTTCKETGFKAWYLTTNTQLRPPVPQLSIFD